MSQRIEPRTKQRRCVIRAARLRAVRARGLVAVEAAFVLPVVLIALIGVWEVGRLVEITAIVNSAARQGGRLAAGGTSNGTNVTVSMVQQTVQSYLTAAGLPSAAANGAQVQVLNQSSHTWTDPCNAISLDPFTVTVVIPSGAAFNSLRWTLLSLTGVTQISGQSEWVSANDSQVTVSTALPF
jgi:Flp pilus assembly protein TadG